MGGLPVIGGTYGVPIVGTINGVTVSGTPSSGEVLTATSSTAADWQAPSGGSPAFSAITSGTNTGAACVLGSGSSLTVSGSGTNNATAIDGVAVTGTPSVGQVPTATGSSAATWQTPTATAVNAVPLPNTKRWSYWSADGSQVMNGATVGYSSVGGVGLGFTNPSSGAFGYSAALGAYVSAYSATGALADFVTELAGPTISKPFYVGNNCRFQAALTMYNSTGHSTASTNWWGFSDQTPTTMGASANPAGNYACFRYVSGTDTNIQCVTKDGTTQTVTDSGVPPTTGFLASTATMLFEIQMNDGTPNVLFYINGALVATIITHLPTSATAMNWQATCKSASSIGVGPALSYVYFESAH